MFSAGARIIYKYLPMCVGLRRLIFLKRAFIEDEKDEYGGSYGFTYVLLCECFNLRESYLASACTTIDQLRARCCGYSALYVNQRQWIIVAKRLIGMLCIIKIFINKDANLIVIVVDKTFFITFSHHHMNGILNQGLYKLLVYRK